MRPSSGVPNQRRGGYRRRLWVNLCIGGILALALVASMASLAMAASFTDVSASHPHYTAINDLSSRGIIGGYGDGRFGPGDPVTRQQFAKMIVRTGDYPVSLGDHCPFGDVATQMGEDPLYPSRYVAVAAAQGITEGKTSSSFDPYAQITRYQVISMVVRAANDLEPGLLTAPPVGYGIWRADATHGANAARAEYNGLLAAINSGSLDPYAPMPRGEVAQVLHNLLGILAAGTTTNPPSADVIAAYSGSGDDVIDVQKPAGPALVWIEGNASARHFAVISYGPGYSGPQTYYDLLVNTSEPYEGLHLIDYWYSSYGDEELTKRFEVKATGPWSIEIRPLNTARTVGTPGQVQGTGDEVILVTGSPDTARIVGNAGARYFGVWAYYGRTGMYDLLVNESEPYDGTVMFSKPNAAVIKVRASQPWSINLQR